MDMLLDGDRNGEAAFLDWNSIPIVQLQIGALGWTLQQLILLSTFNSEDVVPNCCWSGRSLDGLVAVCWWWGWWCGLFIIFELVQSRQYFCWGYKYRNIIVLIAMRSEWRGCCWWMCGRPAVDYGEINYLRGYNTNIKELILEGWQMVSEAIRNIYSKSLMIFLLLNVVK